MRQPNIHHIRRFVDRAKGLKPAGVSPMPNQEIIDVSIGLSDLLLYQKELENEISRLKEELAGAGTITVELQGGSF